MKNFKNLQNVKLDKQAQKNVKGGWGRECRWYEFECEPGICIRRGSTEQCP